MSTSKMSRRDFLKKVGLGGAGLMLAGLTPSFRRGFSGFDIARVSAAARRQMGEPFMPDAEIALTAAEKYVQIYSGSPTRAWGYEGQLLGGSGVTVQNIPGSYLGPIIRAERGRNVRIMFHNNLPEESVIHPHGLRVPEICDGQPMQAIGSGEVKVDEYQVIDQACPAWFHPHSHMKTATQVAMGLAGLFYVTDPDE
ncbi:MAG TPA: multicopper oxidase domain-containing protein, partial [Anaerolineaceae bacterium]|nr:multicopper oxidase domain-containing protein [Anaerolineaceae bacterium]